MGDEVKGSARGPCYAPQMWSARIPTLVWALILLWFAPSAAFAQKTDKVFFTNGDFITVEIKSLERGKLTVKTHGLGTIGIDWYRIARLESDKVFRFEVGSGVDWFGSLLDSESDGELLVQREEGTLRISTDRVVSITPLKVSVRAGIDGYVSAGLSYMKATEITQFNFGLDVSYDARHYAVALKASSNLSRQPASEQSRRNDVSTNYRYYWRPHWFVIGLGGLQQNDELGLQLRSYVTAGVGHKFISTQASSLSASLGFSASKEEATGDTDGKNSLEGALYVEYQVFKLETPKLDIAATAGAFPSLTVSGRMRTNVDIRFRWELIADFNWEVTTFWSSDNKPLNGEAGTSDFGVITGVGYSF
jgi:putative salt-induced outer membrane protein YdiY